ncbi:hypothetical protein [Christiangramia echinicola]|uniref:hypothetical protein n=1 Tax=Christiangramia echinicola TaxID=279359 RepID=UPI00041C9395|nr:hypothetical protein [Christiangramia echinicola]
MEFKGHPNIKKSTLDSGKLSVSSIIKNKKFICHEYFYENNKLKKHIDFINWKISHHSYNQGGERIELRTYSFDEKPEKNKLEGYKNFEYKNGNLIKESHYLFDGKVDKIEYEGKFIYSGKELILEEYHYPNEIYTINYKFDKNKNLLIKYFSDNSGKCEYYYDDKGFLKKFIHFKPNKYCQINHYEYRNNRLHKLIEYPILKFKKKFLTNKIELLEKEQFIHENEFFYNDNGLLIREVKTDILDNYEIDVLQYKYEQNNVA